MILLATAGCGASAGSGDGSGSGSSGPVNVLYAGSLVDLMQSQLGPGFQAATRYSVAGFPGGSTGLANEIKAKVHRGDVFVSASPAVNDSLEGSANGGWVSWYATFATSPLVLGYNPKSHFAAQLRSRPWYDVITEPGFRVGRTDPATDPKGALTVQALSRTAAARHRPALKSVATETDTVFPEESLVGRLQAGQLDAGFFYRSEAVAAGIPTRPLTGVHLRATYTVTVLNEAPNPTGAAAFVRYLLGPAGRASLRKDGFSLVRPPALSGNGPPAALRSVIPTP